MRRHSPFRFSKKIGACEGVFAREPEYVRVNVRAHRLTARRTRASPAPSVRMHDTESRIAPGRNARNPGLSRCDPIAVIEHGVDGRHAAPSARRERGTTVAKRAPMCRNSREMLAWESQLHRRERLPVRERRSRFDVPHTVDGACAANVRTGLPKGSGDIARVCYPRRACPLVR